MDFKTFYFNGDLEEENYMDQSEWFVMGKKTRPAS